MDINIILRDMVQRSVSRMELRFKYNLSNRDINRIINGLANSHMITKAPNGSYRINTSYEDVKNAIHTQL